MGERLRDVWIWVRRKICRHRALSVYEEARIIDFCRVSWSAFHVCPLCGEVLSVEASFSGNVYQVGEAVEAEIARQGGPDG